MTLCCSVTNKKTSHSLINMYQWRTRTFPKIPQSGVVVRVHDLWSQGHRFSSLLLPKPLVEMCSPYIDRSSPMTFTVKRVLLICLGHRFVTKPMLYYIIWYCIILYYIILYYCTWNEKKIQKLSGLTWHVNIHRPSMLNSTCPVKIFNRMKCTVCYNVFWIVKMCLLLTWKRTTPQSWLFMTFLTDLIYTLFSHIYLAHLRIR